MEQSDDAWQRVDVRDGEKGPLVVEMLIRRVATGHRGKAKTSEETLVVIRFWDRDNGIAKQDYYMSNASAGTTHTEFGRVSKAAHRVEECFDRGKGEAGMADYEVRNWTGWQHHHQTLLLLASWFLNVETRLAEKKVPAMTFNQVRMNIASLIRVQCECPEDVDAVVLLPVDFSHQLSSGNRDAMELETMLLTRHPEEIFAAEDIRDWDE